MSDLKREKEELDLKDNLIKSMPYEQIYTFLSEESKVNQVLSESINKNGKNFYDCIKYVYNSVKRLLGNKTGFLEDMVVYNLAIEYYTTDIQIEMFEEVRNSATDNIETKNNVNCNHENIGIEQSLF